MIKQALFVLGVLEGWAAAKPASGAQAEVLFDDAKQLMAKKQYAQACDKFDSSQKLEPAITTLINSADCREKNNQFATAWGLFLDVERQTRGDASAKQLHTLAQTRAKRLEARLSKLTINVATGVAKISGLEVKLGADLVLAGSFGSALPMDGGHYTVTATAPHFSAFKADVEIKPEHDQKSVDVITLSPEPEAPQKPPEVIQPPLVVHEIPRDQLTREIQPTSSQTSHTGAVIVTVAAIAVAGGAVGFELWGRSKLDDAGKEPNDMLQTQLYDDANTRHYIAQGMGVAAIGLAGVAVYLWVRHPSATKDSSALIVPMTGSDRIGLTLSGSY